MRKMACQYAIVRFAPFVETGEFANVGIVMFSASDRYFGFKLETQRYSRITQFFDGVNAKHYKGALRYLRDELNRTRDLLQGHGFDRHLKHDIENFAQALFAELVRPRETIVRFSAPRVVLAQDPEMELEQLFDYYVRRNFVTKQYQETVLEDRVRGWLKEARLQNRFQPRALGDDEYQAKFPFVEMKDAHATKAIKPLHLGQEHSAQIIDRGGAWAFRIEELRKRDKLPDRVLFTVAGPQSDGSARKREHAFQDAVQRLEDTGVTVVDAEENERARVVEFAAVQ